MITSSLPTEGSQQTFKYFEQRRIAEHGIPGEATEEEGERFEEWERGVRDK